jgi:hypothetical protein
MGEEKWCFEDVQRQLEREAGHFTTVRDLIVAYDGDMVELLISRGWSTYHRERLDVERAWKLARALLKYVGHNVEKRQKHAIEMLAKDREIEAVALRDLEAGLKEAEGRLAWVRSNIEKEQSYAERMGELMMRIYDFLKTTEEAKL